MTNQDAIKWLENLKQDIGQLRHEDLWHYEQAIYEIEELLEEQEPKLVRIDEDSVHCPSCGNELFTYPRQKFCDECGQAVKWDG